MGSPVNSRRVRGRIRPMHDVPQQPAGSVPYGRRLIEWLGFGSPRDEAAGDIGSLPKIPASPHGTSSGIEHHELTQSPGDGATVTITCTDFSPDSSRVEEVA